MGVNVTDLSFSYGKHRVLDHVGFSAQRGQMLAVLGANGAGKSTLFRCILGLRRDYSGSVEICHKDIRKLRNSELAHMVAYIPQNCNPVFNYSVQDTILMGTTGSLNLLGTPGKDQILEAEKAMELLQIKDLAHRGIGEISGGELQLVLIARAVVQRAHVLVMDEPTASLDYGNQHRVLQMARNLADENYIILMSTHNPMHARHYATDVLALKDGTVYAEGAAETIVTSDFIQELYGVPAMAE